VAEKANSYLFDIGYGEGGYYGYDKTTSYIRTAEYGLNYFTSNEASADVFFGGDFSNKYNWNYSEELNPDFLSQLTLQIGGSFTSGSIIAITKGLGFFTSYNVLEGFDFGTYEQAGLGFLYRANASINTDFTLSRNRPSEIEGVSVTFGGSYGRQMNVWGGPTYGYDYSRPWPFFGNNARASHTLHPIGWGWGSKWEGHFFITYTQVQGADY
jgi:hypothetical protein